ncbi:hypothetical protein FQN49_000928 [Arthroderma sp. PD_2]|nr:hypothetical protein FQN49_000928 [Arthroderma sp. PD_2]
MTEDNLTLLRRLLRAYGIRFRQPSDGIPQTHTDIFKAIGTLGEQKFDTYSEVVRARTAEEPWTQQTRVRAEWLASRTSHLVRQQRNEAGWRFGLENDVLRRFSIEVACPKCRARVWRSEIEASPNGDDDYARQLEQRRKNRLPCQCLPLERPQDYYEIGTNSLFDDRAQEPIIHDSFPSKELPKQEPDRVYGLKLTKNFQKILSSRIQPALAQSSDVTVSEFVQSAFPIWALLQLQENLLSHKSDESSFRPLVWFLANRGDAWRVYGCYLAKGESNNVPVQYDISLIWNGSLVFKDDALQLVLIIDYILDWARDIYRPSILRLLKSLTTDQAFDQISIPDSNVLSMHGYISNWIPPAPSTIGDNNLLNFGEVATGESSNNYSTPVPTHQSLLPITIPNTKCGSVRSAMLSDFRFTCLYLTTELATVFLRLARGRNGNEGNIEKAARQIINFITQFDEVLLLTGADLNRLEALWTGEDRSGDPAHSEVTEIFYVIMEASCYLNPSWDIVRELSCLAVSEPAFKALLSSANFKVKHRGIESLPQSVGYCHLDVLQNCIECLRSGSPWQILLSAISSTLLAIYPLPERKRPDHVPPVEVLGFGYIQYSRVKECIVKYLKMGVWKVPKQNPAHISRVQDGGPARAHSSSAAREKEGK